MIYVREHKLYAKEEKRWLDVALFATNLLSKAAGMVQTNSEKSPASSAELSALRLSRLSELGLGILRSFFSCCWGHRGFFSVWVERKRSFQSFIYIMAAHFTEWRKLPISLSELCINTTLRCGQSFRSVDTKSFSEAS